MSISSLQRSLSSLASQAPRIVAPAIKSGLSPLLAAVEVEAPVDTGRLAHSVIARQFPPHNDINHGEVVIQTPYVGPVDLGTKEREADDFIQRAFDEESKRAADLVAHEAVRLLLGAL